MRRNLLLVICVMFLLLSCGTTKTTVQSKQRDLLIDDQPLSEIEVELPQLEPKLTKAKTNKSQTEAYIEKFAPIAIRKMQEYNIPASITLAQGVLESGSGRSPLAIRSNNHFGIKCHRGWKGKSVTHDDDEIGECFRKYKYPESSYDDHSKFLTSRKRYATLFYLKNTDYKGWAYGLKRAGYATDKKYPNKLISIIRKYKLDKYDRIKSNANIKAINTSHASKLYRVRKGDTLYSIAKRHKVSVSDLKKKNDLHGNLINVGQNLIIN